MHDFEYQIRNSIFELPHISMETYIYIQGEGGPDPPAFIRIRKCFCFENFFTYLRIFHSVLHQFTRLYKVRT